MKSFPKKVLLSLATFSVLLTSLAAPFFNPPVARAQCEDEPGEYWCEGSSVPPIIVGARFACSIAEIVGIFDDNVDTCLAILYQVNRAVFVSPAPAPWWDPSFISFGRKVFDETNPDEIFGERYTYAQVNWIVNSLIIGLFPPLHAANIVSLFQYIANLMAGIARAGAVISDVSPLINTLPDYGLIGGTYYVMAQIPKFVFADPIASGVGEIKAVAAKFDLASPTFAQGLGYDKLSLDSGSIRPLWIATRNMAYLIATVILIVAGLMVIFRTKISPQASVTVQMIIPRLIVSLTLVTFSFAIVGFVIDMMYVVITAVLGMLYFTQGITGFTIIRDLPQAITMMTGNFNFVTHFLGVFIAIAVIVLIVSIGVALIAVLAPGAAVVIPILSIIMGFFMWSVYVWARIVGQLIVAYITLILLTIAGPIMIIMDILPTSKGGFKKWITCVIGQASVFVSYSLISMVIFMLFDNTTQQIGSDSGFSNDPEGTHIRAPFTLPLFTGGYPRDDGVLGIGGVLLQYFLFMGFMSVVPNIVGGIKNMFCKSTDFSNFLENTVKDTIGQFSKAGQEAGKGASEWMGTKKAAEKGAQEASLRDAQMQYYTAQNAASSSSGASQPTTKSG